MPRTGVASGDSDIVLASVDADTGRGTMSIPPDCERVSIVCVVLYPNRVWCVGYSASSDAGYGVYLVYLWQVSSIGYAF